MSKEAVAQLLVVKQIADEKMGAEARPCVAEECYSISVGVEGSKG